MCKFTWRGTGSGLCNCIPLSKAQSGGVVQESAMETSEELDALFKTGRPCRPERAPTPCGKPPLASDGPAAVRPYVGDQRRVRQITRRDQTSRNQIPEAAFCR